MITGFQKFILMTILSTLVDDLRAERIPASESQTWQSQAFNFPYRPYLQNSNLQNCTYNPKCPDGRNLYWAQQRLNADLMFDYLKSIGLKAGTSKIAVVDSGFDYDERSKFILSPNFRTSKGHSDAGDATTDQDGHGTAVAGLIGAQNGVGLAPNSELTVYKVAPLSKGGVPSEWIEKSISTACLDGNSIINVSWGGFFDEFGLSEAESNQKKFYDELMKQGCLIIKSAGNSSRRQERKHVSAEDNLLRIEASETSNSLSSFSSIGELKAPGSTVFTLRSSMIPDSSYNDRCSAKATGAFVNGTSFSAPLVAAIASQVDAVLRMNPKFSTFLPEKRVRWITRILEASSVDRTVDGLRAVRFAHLVQSRKDFSENITNIDVLKSHFEVSNHEFCSEKLTKCINVAGCASMQNCLSYLREFLSRCPKKIAEVLPLVTSYTHKLQAHDVTLGLLYKDDRTDVRALVQKATYAKNIWNSEVSRWLMNNKNRTPFHVAHQLIVHLIRGPIDSSLSSPDKALDIFLSSELTVELLSRENSSSQQEDLNRTIEVLELSLKFLGESTTFSILKNAFAKWLSSTNNTNGFLSAARVLNSLESQPQLQKKYEARLNSLAMGLMKLSPKIEVKNAITDMKLLDSLFASPARLSETKKMVQDYMRNPEPPKGYSILEAYIIERLSQFVIESEQLNFMKKLWLKFDAGQKIISSGHIKIVQNVLIKLIKVGIKNPDLINNELIEALWSPSIANESNIFYWDSILNIDLILISENIDLKHFYRSHPLYNNETAKQKIRWVNEKFLDEFSFVPKGFNLCPSLSASARFLGENWHDQIRAKWIGSAAEKVRHYKAWDSYEAPLVYKVVQCFLIDNQEKKFIQSVNEFKDGIKNMIDTLREKRHPYATMLADQLELN